MNKEEFIGKLQMVYVGDRNAFNEIVEDNQKLKNELVYSKVEIDRLNKEYERIYNENCKLREEHNITDIKLLDENNRLKNIIDELEKWCNECIDNHIIARENGVTTISDTFFEMVLDKIKALKENK